MYREMMKHKVSAKGVTMAYLVLLLWPVVYFLIVNCFAVLMACTEIIKIEEMNPFFAWTFGPWAVLFLTFPIPLLFSLAVSTCVLIPLMGMVSKFVPGRSFLIGAILIAAILVLPLFFWRSFIDCFGICYIPAISAAETIGWIVSATCLFCANCKSKCNGGPKEP